MESGSGTNAAVESTNNQNESDPSGCGCNSITISVNPTTGGQFDLAVTKNDTIENLKKLISKKLKVPKERICLLYRERQLRDGTIQENQLVNGSRLTLLPSVETGLLAQRPEQSVMQALESLNDSQVNDFLSGKAPLNLTMRLGDHMMLIQLQLSTVTPNQTSSSSGSSNSSTSTSTTTGGAAPSASTNSSSTSSTKRATPAKLSPAATAKFSVRDPLASLTSIVNKSLDENPPKGGSTTTTDPFKSSAAPKRPAPSSSSSSLTSPPVVDHGNILAATTAAATTLLTTHQRHLSQSLPPTPNLATSVSSSSVVPPSASAPTSTISSSTSTPPHPHIPPPSVLTGLGTTSSTISTTSSSLTSTTAPPPPVSSSSTSPFSSSTPSSTPASTSPSSSSTSSTSSSSATSSSTSTTSSTASSSSGCKCDSTVHNGSGGGGTAGAGPGAAAGSNKPTLDTRALAEASRNLTQTLKQLSSEVLTSKSDPVEDVSTVKRRQGAIIESMHHHGKGVYSGTFSGTLNPALQDRFGRPKRDISTIIHILNDLLCATPQYRNARSSTSTPPPDKAPSTTTPASTSATNQTSSEVEMSTSTGGSAAPTSAESLENQATRGKMERLRLIMEERREKRRAARSSPYSRSGQAGGVNAAGLNQLNHTQWSAKSETQRASSSDQPNLPMDTTDLCTQPEVSPEPVVA